MIIDFFDPGNTTGLARFQDRKLVSANKMLFEELMSAFYYSSLAPEAFIETPQVYKVEFQKGDQEDVVGLAIKAGRIAQCYFQVGYKVTYIKPREWKGQRSKQVTMNRAMAALTKEELEKIPGRDHNMWDAIYMGLWKGGRV